MPNGTFIPIKYSHGSDARNILWQATKNKNDFNDASDHILDLWKLGWQRITNSNYLKELCTNNSLHKPNQLQKRELINLAIELESNKVTWDNDEEDTVIWSSDDVMEIKS